MQCVLAKEWVEVIELLLLRSFRTSPGSPPPSLYWHDGGRLEIHAEVEYYNP